MKVVEADLDGAAADVGDDRCAGDPPQRHAKHAARHMDRHDASGPRQEAFHLGGAAVELHLTEVDATQVEEGVPRRTLHLDAPRVRRIDLDLPPLAAAQPANHDTLVAQDGGRRG